MSNTITLEIAFSDSDRCEDWASAFVEVIDESETFALIRVAMLADETPEQARRRISDAMPINTGDHFVDVAFADALQVFDCWKAQQPAWLHRALDAVWDWFTAGGSQAPFLEEGDDADDVIKQLGRDRWRIPGDDDDKREAVARLVAYVRAL